MTQKSQLPHGTLTSCGEIRLNGKDAYTVWIKPDYCNLTSRHLRKITDIAERYGKGLQVLKKKNANFATIIDEIDIEKFKELSVPSAK